MKRFCHLIIFLFFFIRGFSQTTPVEWRAFPIERLPPERRPIFYHVLCMSSGSVLLSSSHGLIRYQGFRLNFPSVGIIAGKNEKVPDEEVRDPHTKDGIRSICRGSGANFFFLTGTRRIYYVDESLISLTGWANPPLYIPITIEKEKTITSIWSDEEDDLFVGVKEDSLVIISGAATHSPSDGEMDSVGNFISKKIAGNTTKIFIPGYPEVYAFTKDLINPGSVLLSTSKGLMRLKKKTGEINYLGEKWADKIITTALLADQKGNIWFSTVNHGMGFYDIGLNKYSFYKGPVQPNKELTVSTFCKKSGNEFFVAIADSLPAIFNIDNHSFFFLEDTIFNRSKNTTTDIRMDGFGNLFVVKGGALFYTHSFSENKDVSGINLDSSAYAPFIYEFHINRRPYFELVKKTTILPHLKEIRLKHNQNQLEFSCSLLEFWDQKVTKMACKIEGLNMDWVELPEDGPDKFKAKFIPPLQPGKYTFRVRAKVGDEKWRKQETAISIIIVSPFWKTWWFWTIVAAFIIGTIIFFYQKHINAVRKKEREKVFHEKELMELEAKALRAQMNPHFVFNSLNSIKSLINKNENDKAAGYLATFSKLIRTLFQNSDNREVSLYEELETCKLYTQLEKMRFGDKVEFIFDIDETVNLKDFKVPALILQPFIENAIWHGLMPKETGGKIIIGVNKVEGAIQCIIEDDGIGRELSIKNKPKYESTHQSKGIGLTQSRLELDKLLNEREDKIFIIDKEDENGKPEGTKVIISFKENRN